MKCVSKITYVLLRVPLIEQLAELAFFTRRFIMLARASAPLSQSAELACHAITIG